MKRTRIKTFLLIIAINILIIFLPHFVIDLFNITFKGIYQYANQISAICAIVAVLAIPFQVYLSSKKRKKDKSGEYIQANSIDKLFNELGPKGGKIPFVNRKVINLETFLTIKKIGFSGIQKVGKTREALELLNQLVQNEIILDGNILTINQFIKDIEETEILEDLKKVLQHKKNIILFIDDLPHFFNGKSLDSLSLILKFAEEYCELVYFVATVRTDQITSPHINWLRTNNIIEYRVPKFSKLETTTFLDNALSTFNISAADNAKTLIINLNNGTPEHIIASLLQLNVNKIETITPAIATESLRSAIQKTWTRSREIIHDQNPLAREILKSLAVFNTIGIKPYTNILFAFISLDQIKTKNYNIFTVRKLKIDLEEAINYLEQFDIVKGEKMIFAPDIALEKFSINDCYNSVLKWTMDLNWIEKNFIIDYLFSASEQFDGLLYYFANSVITDHPNWDIQLKKKLENRKNEIFDRLVSQFENNIQEGILAFAKEKSIKSGYVQFSVRVPNYQYDTSTSEGMCNLGFEYLDLNDLGNAFESFKSALVKDDQNDKAYYGLSILYERWGQLVESEENIQKAISLSNKESKYYVQLGTILKENLHLDLAVDSFKTALAFKENDPSIIGYLITTYIMLEDFESALACIAEHKSKFNHDGIFLQLMLWLELFEKPDNIEDFFRQTSTLIIAALPELTASFLYNPIELLEKQFPECMLIAKLMMKHSSIFSEKDFEDLENVNFVDTFCCIAIFNIMENRMQAAKNLLIRALNNMQTSSILFRIMARISIIEKNYNMAQHFCKNAIKLEESDIDNYIELANCYLIQGDTDNALEQLFKGEMHDPANIDCKITKAWCYKKLDNNKMLETTLSEIKQLKVEDSIQKAKIEILCNNDTSQLIECSQDDLLFPFLYQTEPIFIDIGSNISLNYNKNMELSYKNATTSINEN